MRTMHPLPPPDEPAPGLGAWINEGAKKKKAARKPTKRTARDPKGYATAREEAAFRAKANDWRDAAPRHLVGLYAVLHEQVYGVAPAELVDAWKGAVSAAAAMLKSEFKGDVPAFVEFIRWTWQRARRRKDKAVAEGGEVSRIGWVLQFKSRAMLTDYRVDMAGALEAAKPKGRR